MYPGAPHGMCTMLKDQVNVLSPAAEWSSELLWPTGSGDHSALCTRQPSGRRHRSLQVLAKFAQHRLTQAIRIEFAGFCTLDNSFDDSFTNKITLVAKLKGCASHFECDAHDLLGLGIEFGTVQKLRDWHDLPHRVREDCSGWHNTRPMSSIQAAR